MSVASFLYRTFIMKKNIIVYVSQIYIMPTTTTSSLERHAYWCRSGRKVIWVLIHYLIGFKGYFTRWHWYQALASGPRQVAGHRGDSVPIILLNWHSMILNPSDLLLHICNNTSLNSYQRNHIQQTIITQRLINVQRIRQYRMLGFSYRDTYIKPLPPKAQELL